MILDQIVEKKRGSLAKKKQEVSFEEIKRKAEHGKRVPIDFGAALTKNSQVAIIGEVKKASPSKGLIRPDFDPLFIAKQYRDAGVEAISVLTEEDFFQGSPLFLNQIRQRQTLPLLRKDFIIDAYQIYEAYVLGADALLLIAAILDHSSMTSYLELAEQLGMQCLVEAHNAEEIEQALSCGAKIIGINNRNLHTFEENIKTTEYLRSLLPSDKIIVSESGIRTPEDLHYLNSLGIDAVLIGEAFMRSENIVDAVKRMRLS
jgi:indole-3-glycerol phosphate synthase